MIWSDPDSYQKNRFRYFGPERLVRSALTSPEPRPEPGTDHQYTNTGYILAGMVVERVSGHSVESALRDRIFRPLGMRDSSYSTITPFIAGSHLKGYLPGEPGAHAQDTTVYSMSWARSAGAVSSTVGDETRFLQGLFTGRLLPRRLLAEMMDDQRFGYGLGLVKVQSPCGPVWGHNGAVFGYHSAVFSTPDGTRQAVVAINTWLLDDNGNIRTDVERTAAAAVCTAKRP